MPRPIPLKPWAVEIPLGMDTILVRVSAVTKSEARGAAKAVFAERGRLKPGERLPVGSKVRLEMTPRPA